MHQGMKTDRLEDKFRTKINLVLHYLLSFIEFTLVISILIFCFFIIQGYLIMGDLQFNVSRSSISRNDILLVVIMIYPMTLGIILWMFFNICGLITGLKRKWKFVIGGLLLCLINVLLMNTSQFSWILG